MILWRNIEIFHFLSPDFPHFYYMLGANLGSPLYGAVSVMVFGQIGLENSADPETAPRGAV